MTHTDGPMAASPTITTVSGSYCAANYAPGQPETQQ